MRTGRHSADVGLKLAGMAALLLRVGLLLLPPVALAQQAVAPKRSLLLYWESKDFPGNVRFDKSFQGGLQSAPAWTVEYYSEYLEPDRFPGENQALVLR